MKLLKVHTGLIAWGQCYSICFKSAFVFGRGGAVWLMIIWCKLWFLDFFAEASYDIGVRQGMTKTPHSHSQGDWLNYMICQMKHTSVPLQ